MSGLFVRPAGPVTGLFTLLREGPPRCEFESLESGRSTLRPYTLRPYTLRPYTLRPYTLRPYTATPPAAGSVGAILRAFKAAVTRRGMVEAGHLGPVWQRNYYQHIIRNDQEYLRARSSGRSRQSNSTAARERRWSDLSMPRSRGLRF